MTNTKRFLISHMEAGILACEQIMELYPDEATQEFQSGRKQAYKEMREWVDKNLNE